MSDDSTRTARMAHGPHPFGLCCKSVPKSPTCTCPCHYDHYDDDVRPQPQQSETTFEAWWQANYPNGSAFNICEEAWNAALRSQQVAPEVVEAIARAADSVTLDMWSEMEFDDVKRLIAKAIAQAGKAGE